MVAWRKENSKELRELNSTSLQSPTKAPKRSKYDRPAAEDQSSESDHKGGDSRNPPPARKDADILHEGFTIGANNRTPLEKGPRPAGEATIVSLLEPSLSDHFGVPADKVLFGKIMEAEGFVTSCD